MPTHSVAKPPQPKAYLLKTKSQATPGGRNLGRHGSRTRPSIAWNTKAKSKRTKSVRSLPPGLLAPCAKTLAIVEKNRATSPGNILSSGGSSIGGAHSRASSRASTLQSPTSPVTPKRSPSNKQGLKNVSRSPKQFIKKPTLVMKEVEDSELTTLLDSRAMSESSPRSKTKPHVKSYADALSNARRKPEQKTPDKMVNESSMGTLTITTSEYSVNSDEDDAKIKRAVGLSKSMNRHSKKEWMRNILKKEKKRRNSQNSKTSSETSSQHSVSINAGEKIKDSNSQSIEDSPTLAFPGKVRTLTRKVSPNTEKSKRANPFNIKIDSGPIERNDTLKKLTTIGQFEFTPSELGSSDSEDDSDDELLNLERQMRQESKFQRAIGGTLPKKNTISNKVRLGVASKFLDEDRRASSLKGKLPDSPNLGTVHQDDDEIIVPDDTHQNVEHVSWKAEVRRTILEFNVHCVDNDQDYVLKLEVRMRNIKVKTIGNVKMYSAEELDMMKTLDHGRELEIRQLEKRTINGKDTYCVPVLDAGSNGVIPILSDGKQSFELTDGTWDFSFLTLYSKDEEKTVYKEHQFFDFVCTEFTGNELLFDLGEDFQCTLVFESNLEKAAVWYVLSENRNLSDEERLHRLVSRYSEDQDLDEVFEAIVITRIPPTKREEYEHLDFGDKMKKILLYDQELERNFKDYLNELDHCSDLLLAEDLSLMRGCIQFSSSEEVSEFVQDLGLVRIIEIVKKHDHVTNKDEVQHCALECFEAVMNKPPDDHGDMLGAEHVLQNGDVLWFIVNNLNHPNEEVRFLVVNILLGLFHITEEQYADHQDESLQGFQNLFGSLHQFATDHEQKSIWWAILAEFDKEIKQDAIENVDHCLNIAHLINQILNNPNLGLIERVEARVMLEYLGFEHASNLIIGMLKKDVAKHPEHREKLEEFEHQFEMYQQQTDQDYKHMPGAEECFEYLFDHTKDQGVYGQFQTLLQYTAMIPSEMPDLWDSLLDAAESIILHKVELADPAEIRLEFEDKMKAKDEEIQKLIEKNKITIKPLKNMCKRLREENATLRDEGEKSKQIIANLEGEITKLKSELANRPTGDSAPTDVTMTQTAVEPSIDPKLMKYVKMFKMHIPKHAVMNKMRQDGVDEDRFQEVEDYIAGKVKASKQKVALQNKLAPAKPAIDPKLEKYAKMLKMHIPKHAVINKMRQDGVDEDRFQEIQDYINGKLVVPVSTTKPPVRQAAPAKPSIDPKLAKYAKMLKMHIPKHAVMNKMRQDGVDEDRFQEVEDFVAGKAPPAPVQQSAPAAPATPTIDPKLQKYAKMLKMHIPKHAVMNKMRQDGVDEERFQEIEDFVAGKAPAVAVTQSAPPPATPSIDPKLQKYAKMLKMHIPPHAVKNKMRQDGVDEERFQEVEDFVAGKAPAAASAPPPPAAKPELDPKLKKYMKMIKMNIPKNAVQNKMRQDGIDVERMQEIEDFIAGKLPKPKGGNALSLKEKKVGKVVTELPEELKKYHKMLKMHIPKHAVENKMVQNGVDKSRMAEIESFMNGTPMPVKDEPESSGGKVITELPKELAKYHKMLKMHIPQHVVENKMTQDGVKKERMAEIESFMTGKPMPGTGGGDGGGGKVITELPEELKKYHKMLKMKIPKHVVENKMVQNGVKKSRMAEIESFMTGKPMPGSGDGGGEGKVITELPEELKKYHKMLKMHIPTHVVENKMVQNGIKKSRMAEIESFMTGKPMKTGGGAGTKKGKKKGKLKKKKKKHAPDETWKDSGFFGEVVKMDSSKFLKASELEIFTAKPVKKVKKEVKKKKPKKPKAVCLVQDGKIHQRMTFFCAGMKRDKIENKDIVAACWELNAEKVDLEALSAILPKEDGMHIVREYHDDVSKLDLPSKLYYALQHVPKLAQRADVWMFIEGFDVQEANYLGQVDVVRKAVDVIARSKKMKMMMAGALTLLRTTSDWKYVHGFPLQSLYTVAKKKCADGQTWLMKMCQFVEEREPDLLEFREELELVKNAEKFRDVGGLLQSVDKFGLGIKRAKNRLKSYKNVKVQEGFNDNFVKKVEEFVKHADPDFKRLTELANKLGDDCKSIAKDFGLPEIDEKKGPNTDYFPLIYSFATYTNQAMEMNNKIKELKKREERKARAKAKKEALRQKKAAEREAKKKGNSDSTKKKEIRRQKQEKKEAEEKKSAKAAKMKKTLDLASGAKNRNRLSMPPQNDAKHRRMSSTEYMAQQENTRSRYSMGMPEKMNKRARSGSIHPMENPRQNNNNLAASGVFKRSATSLHKNEFLRGHKRTRSSMGSRLGTLKDNEISLNDSRSTPMTKRRRNRSQMAPPPSIRKSATHVGHQRKISRFRSGSTAADYGKPQPRMNSMRRMKTFQFQERPRQPSNSSIVWKPDDFTSLLENSNNLPKVGIGELSGLAEAPELAEQASIARNDSTISLSISIAAPPSSQPPPGADPTTLHE